MDRLNRNLPIYFTFKFLKDFNFWLPVFTLYFLDSGLNYTQILVLLSIRSLSQLLFEMPSGVIADFFGRKTTLILASLFKLLFMLCMFSASYFWVSALAFCFFGISLAMESGAGSALLFDTLKDLKKESEYIKLEGYSFGYAMLGLGLGSLAGGLLAEVSYAHTIALSSLSFLASLIAACMLHEPKSHFPSRESGYLMHLKQALRFVWTHHELRSLVFFSGAVLCTMESAFRMYQPYMNQAGLRMAYFGPIYFVGLIVCFVGARYGYYFLSKLGNLGSLVLIGCFASLHLIILSQAEPFFVFIAVCAGEFAFGYLRPVVNGWANHQIESASRATALSVFGFIQGLFVILISPLVGISLDFLGLGRTALFLGIISFLLCLILIVPLRKTEPRQG